MNKRKTNRKALIVGASGLVGRYCLQRLLEDPNFSEVIALVRKPLKQNHQKLREIDADFDNIEQVLSVVEAHDIFCCLGTTIKKAGSEKGFKKIDLSLVVKVAEVMRIQGAEQFLVISAMGADTNSKMFYNRVKGEMETALQGLNYPCLRILRPSLLLGPREEFRFGEKIGVIVAPIIKPFLFGSMKKYRPVDAESVASFMVRVASKQPISGIHIYESDVLK